MMGGVASSYWGLAHFTRDLDVVVGSTAEDAPAPSRALDDAYLAAWADRLGVRDRLLDQWRRSGRELRP